MDSDPVAPTGVPDKKMSPWFQFVARVRTLTGLSQPDAMKLASELRSEKNIDTWTDTEIAPRGVKWLRQNYLVMTSDSLHDKIDDFIALKEKEKEVEALKGEVMAFIAEKRKIPCLAESIDSLEEYYTKEVPLLFKKAFSELYEKVSEDTDYIEALITITTIRHQMKIICDSEKIWEESAKKEAEKAAAKEAKEKEKAESKAAKEAEKAAQKAAKEAEKEAAKAEKAASKKGKEKVCEEKSAPAPPVVPSGGAGSESSEPDELIKKSIPKHIKSLVWNTYIGEDKPQGKCVSCCVTTINIRDFHCGHVLARSKGGDLTIKNLRPICAPCNGSMGTMSMNEFTKKFFGREI